MVLGYIIGAAIDGNTVGLCRTVNNDPDGIAFLLRNVQPYKVNYIPASTTAPPTPFSQNLDSACKPIVTKPKPKVEPPKDDGVKDEGAKAEGEGGAEGEEVKPEAKGEAGEQGTKMEEEQKPATTEQPEAEEMEMDLD